VADGVAAMTSIAMCVGLIDYVKKAKDVINSPAIHTRGNQPNGFTVRAERKMQ